MSTSKRRPPRPPKGVPPKNLPMLTSGAYSRNALRYDPAYCERIIEWGARGQFPAEWASRLKVTERTIYNWIHQYPEFAYAVEIAKTACQAWWERAGREGITNPQFKTGIWTKVMERRFPRAMTLNQPGPPAKGNHDLDPLDTGEDAESQAPVGGGPEGTAYEMTQGQQRRMLADFKRLAIEAIRRAQSEEQAGKVESDGH